MKEEEKIEDALERFSKVFNGLNMLGKKFSEKEIMSKWNAKVSAIQEGRNYDQLTFDQLRGNLLTYEMTILDTQGGENKKKSLALKASSQEEDSDENENQDEEFALLLKRFNKFAKRKNFNFKSKNKAPKCYECGEVGHNKPNCPKLQKGEKDKKSKKKQKAYISWENEDETSLNPMMTKSQIFA
ncbi:hypothetical protein PIB30_099451 [Stylosanthes scabra]|uniref:CCHC-type domain-containing protein n=1 Tax=Stylosanthes scabra TaxID=79078 RepID=A0ABU6WXV7_9FABA|nr:hypothetical protein [Stylosanthes scabra]